MKELITLVQPAFEWTWKNSVQVAVLIGLVLLVQKVLGRWLTPRLRYALSLLILFRLLLPAVPPSPLSLENLFTPSARLATREAVSSVVAEPAGPITSMAAEPVPVASTPARPADEAFASPAPVRPPALSLAEVLGMAWACGLLALASLAGWRYAQWCRLIRQGRRLSDPRLLALLDGAREAMGVRRPVTLVVLARLSSPAVFGFWRVRLLLPEDALDHLTDQDLRLLFLHEMAHVRRQDMLLNVLLMAVQFVHWFNPLVWVGLHRLRADRELVCDAMVLHRTKPEERPGYGGLLLKLLGDFPAGQRMIPTAVPVVSSKREIKMRIVLIKYHRCATRTACVATGLAVAALACLTFTGSSQQPAVVPDLAISQPVTSGSATSGLSSSGLSVEERVKASRLVRESKLLYEMGKLDEAQSKLKLALKDDPNNGAARFYLNLVAEEKANRALNNLAIATQSHYTTNSAEPSALVSLNYAGQEHDTAMEIQGRFVAEWVAEVNIEQEISGPNPALNVLVSAGPRVLTNLADLLLHTPSTPMQVRAANAIGVIAYRNPGAPELPCAVPALAFAAQSDDILVRLYGIQGLGAIGRGASNTIPLLVRSTKDEDSGVRMSAVEALGRIGIATLQTVDALKRGMLDQSGDVRITSVTASYALGQPVSNTIPVLVQLTKDKSVGVRCVAVETLGRVGTNSPAAMVALKRALNDESEMFVRPLAREALKKLEAKGTTTFSETNAGSPATYTGQPTKVAPLGVFPGTPQPITAVPLTNIDPRPTYTGQPTKAAPHAVALTENQIRARGLEGEFIRKPGQYHLDDGWSILTITGLTSNSWSLKVTWRSEKRTATGGLEKTEASDAPPRCLGAEGWFVFVETPERIWVYDGLESGTLLMHSEKELGSAVFSPELMASCPQKVWNAFPKGFQENNRKYRKLDDAANGSQPIHSKTNSTSHRVDASPPASVAVTDLGTIAVNDHDWYQCTLSGARICRVCLTAIPNGHVLVEVVVLSQDAQGQPQRILARPRTETDLGKKVSLGIGEGSVSLTPEIKPRAKL